jgi:hypothetical protein
MSLHRVVEKLFIPNFKKLNRVDFAYSIQQQKQATLLKKIRRWAHGFKATVEVASGHVTCVLPVQSFYTVTPTCLSTN